MPSSLEEQSLDHTLANFIEENLNDKLLSDVENPVCRLVSSRSSIDSPKSDTYSKTLEFLKDLKPLINNSGNSQNSNLQTSTLQSSNNEGLEHRSSSMHDDHNVKNNINVLEYSEAVIEYQRERINILEKTGNKYMVALEKANELHRDELEKLEKQNKEMRIQMHKVVSDHDAIYKRYQANLGELDALKGRSLEADSEILRMKKENNELTSQLELLYRENDLLRTQRNESMEEAKKLKNELYPETKSWQRSPTHHVNPESFVQPHLLCDVRRKETVAMGRCLMQVENDLSTYKRLFEEQRSEINRLNSMLENSSRVEEAESSYCGSHKQLMYLRDVFVNIVKKSNQLTESLKVQREVAEKEDRSLQTAYLLRSNAEQREMYDKLLDIVRNMISVKSSNTSFYHCKVDYCRIPEMDAMTTELRFNRMVLEVEDALLLIHQVEDDHIVNTEVVTLDGVKRVRCDYKNLQFVLLNEFYHIFKLDDSDKYNRLYYALQYAGFLVGEGKVSIFSKADFSYLNSEENWPLDLVPVLFSKVITNNFNSLELGLQSLLPNRETDVEDEKLGSLVRRVFENVSVLSDFTPSLLYYEQNSKSLVFYGPNLANRPKVINTQFSYVFKVKNDASAEGAKYLNLLELPSASFPNGESVTNFFNPQFNNYALLCIKPDNLEAESGEMEFEIYYLLPFSGRYNEMLANEMERIKFLRLKLGVEEESEVKFEVVDDKFYTFVDGVLEVRFVLGDEPIRIPSTTGQYKVDESKFEVTLSNVDQNNVQSFTLSIPVPTLYTQFLSDLQMNGFKLVREEDTSSTGQLCLVTKGFVQLFDNYDSNSVPIAVFQPQDTTVEVDNVNRNIVITQKLDKVVTMNLDCLKPQVFNQWIHALKFAGFLEMGSWDQSSEENTKFTEFRFEIKIFDEESTDRRAIRVTREKIYLLSTPNSNMPVFTWEKGSTNIELYPENRRIRLYIKKHSKHEERFDLMPPLLSDYQKTVEMLERMGYKLEDHVTKFGLKYHYIVSKPGVLSLHKTKYEQDAIIKVSTRSYDAIVHKESRTIRFKPKVATKCPIKLVFKKETMFKKFSLALKVADFFPFTKESKPIFFFPKIVYAFTCPEAKSLFKDCIK